MDEALGQFGAAVAGALAGAVTDHAVAFGELTIITNAADIIKVVTFLRDDERCQFISFIDVTAIDWPDAKDASTSSIIFSRPSRTAASG